MGFLAAGTLAITGSKCRLFRMALTGVVHGVCCTKLLIWILGLEGVHVVDEAEVLRLIICGNELSAY